MTWCGKKMLHAFFMDITFLYTREIRILDTYYMNDFNVKPKLEWTYKLHERFVEVVTQLGGADKATPKSVMRLMGVRGLTLYHLKRQLQKYKLVKNGISNPANEIQKQVKNYMVAESRIGNDKSHHQTNKAMLQIQMDIQRKLEAQIEVQKHLQLRMEAQGKYLQSVLSKAHEIIAGYCSSYIPVETARAELSELASAVNIGCMSSTFSHGGLIHEKTQNSDCLLDSCSTSEKFNLNPHKMTGETEEIDLNGY